MDVLEGEVDVAGHNAQPVCTYLSIYVFLTFFHHRKTTWSSMMTRPMGRTRWRCATVKRRMVLNRYVFFILCAQSLSNSVAGIYGHRGHRSRQCRRQDVCSLGSYISQHNYLFLMSFHHRTLTWILTCDIEWYSIGMYSRHPWLPCPLICFPSHSHVLGFIISSVWSRLVSPYALPCPLIHFAPRSHPSSCQFEVVLCLPTHCLIFSNWSMIRCINKSVVYCRYIARNLGPVFDKQMSTPFTFRCCEVFHWVRITNY